MNALPHSHSSCEQKPRDESFHLRWFFAFLSPCASEHRMKNAVNNRSQNPGNGVAEWGWDVGRHAWLWILWKSTAQAPLSIVTSLGCSLVSLSLGADRIIFCIRAEAGPTLHTEDSISHSRPHCGQGDTGNHAGVSVAVAIHHFVLLKVFDCPAQLRGAASARFCYLVTQMEVFNFKSRDLSEQPRLLLSVPLQTVMAVKQKSRSEMCGFVRCEDGHLESASAAHQKSEGCF